MSKGNQASGPFTADTEVSRVQPVLIIVLGKSHQIIFNFGFSF
jgi:hypothetical protein